MPNRSSKKHPSDVNALAAQIVQEATGEAKPEDSGKKPGSGRPWGD